MNYYISLHYIISLSESCYLLTITLKNVYLKYLYELVYT